MLGRDVSRNALAGTFGGERRDHDDGSAAHRAIAVNAARWKQMCSIDFLLLHDLERLSQNEERADVVDVLHLAVLVERHVGNVREPSRARLKETISPEFN